MFDDFEILSASYRVMLQKLLDTVPNITRQGSAIGGFSNGSHAVSVLLAGKDEFILSHFESFFLLEGPIGLYQKPLDGPEDLPVLLNHRFLILEGSLDDAEKIALIEAATQRMKEQGIDITFVVMKGYGHDDPPQYKKLIGNWVRREPLPVITPPVVHTMPQEGLIANADWKIVRVSSESRINKAYAKNAIDGDPLTGWYTQWKGGVKKHPHELLIDLGHEHEIRGFRYLPRQDTHYYGTLKECEFYVATSPTDFGKPAVHAMFKKVKTAQEVTCKPIRGRYILLKALSSQDDATSASVAELGVIGE